MDKMSLGSRLGVRTWMEGPGGSTGYLDGNIEIQEDRRAIQAAGNFHERKDTLIPSIVENTSFEIKDETVGFIDWEDASTVKNVKEMME